MNGGHYVQVERELGVSVGSTHNFVEEEKKNTPDFDELRRLNIMLRNNDLTVYDAGKAAEFAEIVKGYGLRVEDLGDYLSLTEGFLSENGLEPDFIGYALQFKRLSQENGMAYGDFIQDCQRKQEEARSYKATKTLEQAELETIRAEVKEAGLILRQVTAKIKRYTSLDAGLKKIGLDKLARVVQFIPEFEALNYDAQEVKKFGDLKRKLEDLNINPDKLEMELAEKGSIAHQNLLVACAVEEGRSENQKLTELNEALLNRNSKLNMLDQITETRLMPMPCKCCGYPIYVKLECDEFYRNMIEQNMFLHMVCPACGCYLQFTGWDIVFQAASLIIPKTVTIPL
jgi:hypothetical protein